MMTIITIIKSLKNSHRRMKAETKVNEKKNQDVIK